MTVYGLSQTSGVERLLEVERSPAGILLHVREQPQEDRENIVVKPEALVELLSDPPNGVSTIEGTSPVYGTRKLLDLEVRRNEVLLCVRPETGGGCDVAVGLDDFQDAVEAAS